MKRQFVFGIAALSAAFSVTALTPIHASTLGKIGKSITYPFKKGAGNGSKTLNHAGKSVTYPVRKTGVNVSKTAHKATGQH